MKAKLPIFFTVGLLLVSAAPFLNTMFAESESNLAIEPGATVSGLRMEARARLIDDDGGQKLIVHAFLINEGSENVTVLTKDLGPSKSVDANGLVIGFDYTGRQKFNGKLIIPSLIPNEPVELRHGEVAMLNASVPANAKEGDKIRVGYFVTEDWGTRFEIWHGYVCAEVPIERLAR